MVLVVLLSRDAPTMEGGSNHLGLPCMAQYDARDVETFHAS